MYVDPSGEFLNLIAGAVAGVVTGVVVGVKTGDWKKGVVAGAAVGVGVATFGAAAAVMGTYLGAMVVAGGLY